jgi:hypothetical protein
MPPVSSGSSSATWYRRTRAQVAPSWPPAGGRVWTHTCGVAGSGSDEAHWDLDADPVLPTHLDGPSPPPSGVFDRWAAFMAVRWDELYQMGALRALFHPNNQTVAWHGQVLALADGGPGGKIPSRTGDVLGGNTHRVAPIGGGVRPLCPPPGLFPAGGAETRENPQPTVTIQVVGTKNPQLAPTCKLLVLFVKRLVGPHRRGVSHPPGSCGLRQPGARPAAREAARWPLGEAGRSSAASAAITSCPGAPR